MFYIDIRRPLDERTFIVFQSVHPNDMDDKELAMAREYGPLVEIYTSLVLNDQT